MSMFASDEIHGKVARVLVEALGVDEDEITPAATLQGDLGAESIDMLDIVFRLEREFGVRIPRGELFPESVFQRNPEFVPEGRVTDEGMSELRWRMPYLQGGGLFVTDNGNHIVDCQIGPIADPARLENDIRAIPGVVGTGLFLGMADTVLVGNRNDFQMIEERRR
jgi:acyl carrier protein